MNAEEEEEETELIRIRAKIIIYLAKVDLKVNKTNLKKLLKNKSLGQEINETHYGFIQNAIESLLPPRTKEQIQRDIEKVEQKMHAFTKRNKSSAGAYNRDLGSYSHQLKLLNQELKNAKY